MFANISYNNFRTNIGTTFTARPKLPKATKLNELASDIVELSSKNKPKAPEKLELTESEKAIEQSWMRLRTLEMNAKTQKEALKYYYSASDKHDYQELLKEKQKLINQLKRMAKKEGRDYFEIGLDIDTKKSYNRYAKKVLKTRTKEELTKIEEELKERTLFTKARTLLTQLIEEHGQTLKK